MTQYPAVVHVDIDFAFKEPMDELFDAMLYPKDSPEGQAARALIQLEQPNVTMPDKIDAFITRDWSQVRPGKMSGFQAGFMVVRPDPTVFDELREIVLEGNYTGGLARMNGWGGLGYGSFVGARAMQGLMAYYWDVIRPNTAVELSPCRYNWMGMDVLFRAPPAFDERFGRTGDCRNNKAYCEDCLLTETSLIKSIHYTQCRKPWNCVGRGTIGGDVGTTINTESGSLDRCLEMVEIWHAYRTDFETKLAALTNDGSVLLDPTSGYKPEVFHGHCSGEGGENYTNIQLTGELLSWLPELYNIKGDNGSDNKTQ